MAADSENLGRFRAMLNLLVARISALIDERWAAQGRAPEALYAAIEERLPGRAIVEGVPLARNDWDLALRVDVLHLQDLFATTEAEDRGMQYVLDAFNEWGRAGHALMSPEDFDRQFRRLIAAAEALGMDREIIARLQVRLPNWAIPLAAGIGGAAGAAAGPVAVVGAVQGLGFGAGGIIAGSSAATMMSQGALGVPMLQSIGTAGLGVAGTGLAIVSGGVVAALAVGSVAYGINVHWENLARERVSRPTFNSSVLFNNTRVRLFSVFRQRFVTVQDKKGVPLCAEVNMPPGVEGQFDFGYTPSNMVWLRSALNGRYLSNGWWLRFDGETPDDFERFELIYKAHNRFVLKSVRAFGGVVAVRAGLDSSMHCGGAVDDEQAVFEFLIL